MRGFGELTCRLAGLGVRAFVVARAVLGRLSVGLQSLRLVRLWLRALVQGVYFRLVEFMVRDLWLRARVWGVLFWLVEFRVREFVVARAYLLHLNVGLRSLGLV